MTDTTITRMGAETLEIATTVARQSIELGAHLAPLVARLQASEPQFVITCARGSSDHAAAFAKYAIESRLGVMVASHAPSTSSLYARTFRGIEGALFLAISQSGRSPDILASIERARAAGAITVAIVNDMDSPAAALAEFAVPVLAGPELAVAATKSCAGSMTAVLALVAAWADDAGLSAALAISPERLDSAAACDWGPAVAALDGARSLFTIGRGLTFGIALEAALKLKETCQLHAEGFSAAEVRHGPMALVGPGFPVLLFVPDDPTRASFPDLVREFAARGGPVLAAGGGLEPALPLELPARLHPMVDPVIQLTAFYRLAETLARSRGLDPDAPPYLAKVTRTA